MSTDYVERTTTLIRSVEGRDLLPHAIRLLLEGEPVALERLTDAIGWSVEAVEAELGEQASAERDDTGRLVGFSLTLRPTSHRFTVDGRTLYAWCASDTLMFPVILGRDGIVESTCPQTGRPIRVELTPDGVERLDPSEAVVSAVRPSGRLVDVRGSTCDHGHFFSSAGQHRVGRGAPRGLRASRGRGLPAGPSGHRGAGLGCLNAVLDRWAPVCGC